WCDFHKHVRSAEDAQRSISESKGRMNCYPALLYPYEHEQINHKMRVETQTPTKEHAKRWEQIKEVVEKYNEPGKFVTMPGYEWHGNRRCYGDLNLFYFDKAPSLVYPKTLNELYTHLRKHNGMALPHHTAYAVGHCGTDWS